MALLTPENFSEYQKFVRSDPATKLEVLAAGFSKQAWMAGMQALEDGYTEERAAFRTAFETAVGGPVSNVLALAVEKAWMQEKARNL